MDFVVLDVRNLMLRHLYGAKGVEWASRPLAALHAFVRDLPKFADQFGSPHFCFAFDAPPYKRTQLLPGYKVKPKKSDDEEAVALEEIVTLTAKLGGTILNQMGYTNIYSRKGYEADDIMAALRLGLPDGSRCILVTGDRDVYQLLDSRCAVYHPVRGELVTALTFKAQYGIKPKQWVEVKALAGCTSDKIPGCPGVQEKTALKYLKGELPAHHKVYADILEFVRGGGIPRNVELVELPFPGLGTITPASQPGPESINWKPAAEVLGIPERLLFDAPIRRAVRTGVDYGGS